MNEIVMAASGSDIAVIAERIDLMRRSMYTCAIMISNMQPKQAITQFQDAKRSLKEVQELIDTMDRKLSENS